MTYGEGTFRDREDAGQKLAERLAGYRDERPAVFAMPRGGAPLGYEIARSLGAPLDVIVARKLGAPSQPEFGIGAVAPEGVRVLNERAVEQMGIPEDYIQRAAEEETAEIERRLDLLRGDRPQLEVKGRTVILVDDGIATGVSVRAAIASLRRREPQRLVLAVPVCALQTAEAIRSEVDELVCLQTPPDVGAIGFWYRDFEQVSDEEVVQLLNEARRAIAG